MLPGGIQHRVLHKTRKEVYIASLIGRGHPVRPDRLRFFLFGPSIRQDPRIKKEMMIRSERLSMGIVCLSEESEQAEEGGTDSTDLDLESAGRAVGALDVVVVGTGVTGAGVARAAGVGAATRRASAA